MHAEHYGGATRALAACRLNGWPMVYSVHSLLGEEVERDRLGRGLVFRTYRALERRVCRHAAGVVVLGEGVKRIMASEKGVPADRIAVIHPGVNLLDYAPGPPAAIDGIAPEHKVVMYVGNIRDPNQGVPILVEALPSVFEAVPEARCVLVGGPIEVGEHYRARLGRFGDRLHILAGRTPDQITALTRRADVLVHPRLACRENDSVQTKMAVYLASGRPIVATDYGDYPKNPRRHRRRPAHPRRPRAAGRRHRRGPDRRRPRGPPRLGDPIRRRAIHLHGPQRRSLPRPLPDRAGPRPPPPSAGPPPRPDASDGLPEWRLAPFFGGCHSGSWVRFSNRRARDRTAPNRGESAFGAPWFLEGRPPKLF